MEITFAEMYSGIAGFRYGLEKANQSIHSGREHRREGVQERDLSNSEKPKHDLEQEIGSRECLDSQARIGSAEGQCESFIEGNDGRQFQEFRCVWSNDIDKYACQIYRKHYGEKELVEGDIRTIDPSAIPDFDLLTAGFPCQSFSLAGKRKGFQDIRGTLFYEIVRVARIKRPKLLLLENVTGILSNDNGKTFGTILESLGNIGYWVEWKTLNSKHFGVPQNRERVFIIGHSRTEPSRQIFPFGEADSVASEKASGEQEHVSTCIDSNYWKGADKHGQRTMIYDGLHHQYTEKMGTLTGRENRQGTSWLVVADRTRSYADLGRNLESPKDVTNAFSGVQKDNLVLAVETACTRSHMRGRRFSKGCHAFDGGKSKAVMIANAVDCDGYLRSGARPRDENGKPQLLPIGIRRIRRLTPVECERLQGFPDGWTRTGLTKEGSQVEISDTQRYKVLGNAVTTNVITYLGKHLSSLFCC